MTAAAENRVPHKYVITKGSETFIALSYKLDSHFSQAARTEEVYLHLTCLSRKCYKSLVWRHC